MSEITPKGKMSQKEAIRSARDAWLVTIGILVPQLVEIVSNTDFGEYNWVVSLVLGAAMPFLNRYFNIARV